MDRNIFFYVFFLNSVFPNFVPKTKRVLPQNVSDYQLDLCKKKKNMLSNKSNPPELYEYKYQKYNEEILMFF